MQGFRGLNKGKAGGLQIDSLDLFIKLVRNPNKGEQKKSQFANRRKNLAQFFTSIANGEVPDKPIHRNQIAGLIHMIIAYDQ